VKRGSSLEESKIFVVARVIAVFSAAQLNGDFQIGQSGIGFNRVRQIQRREVRIVNVIGLLGEAFAGLCLDFRGPSSPAGRHSSSPRPAGNARSAVCGLWLLRRASCRCSAIFRCIPRAVGEFLAGAFQVLFQVSCLALGEFLPG